ncbi:MAG: tetratricopeptide repeat protein [Acidobacteria bacterium]|nr:tetratricopeptide repeat protein [Acidobacteriota bacterium]
MTKRQPRLSLCMIVKNEQRWLEDCLNSVKELVDEMMIVDTGSRDNTVEIAEGFGAKVFHHPWNGDFSEARNHSLGYATGDWILVLDADEKLAQRDARLIRHLMASTKVDGLLLAQRSYLWNARVVSSIHNPQDYDEGSEFTHCLEVWVLRLFRNQPEIRFRGRVHELVEHVFLEKHLPFEKASPVIHHFGKVGDTEALERKRTLYLELGRQKALEEPNQAPPHYEMGVQLIETERFAESIPYLERAYALDPIHYGISLLLLAKAHHAIGQMEKAGKVYQQCLKLNRDDPRVLFEVANFNRDIGQLKTARKLFMDVLKQDPKHVLATYNLGGVYLKLGEEQTSFELFKKAARLNPHNEAIFEQMGKLALTGFHSEEIAGLVEDFLERFPQSRACPGLLDQICFRLKQPERAIRWATRALELEPHAIHRLIRAHASLSCGRFAEAERDYLTVLEQESTHLDSLMNLAALAELQGNSAAAESRYRQVLEHYPEHPVALKKYGLLLGCRAPNREALEILERAHQANGEDTELLLLLGFVYEKQGAIAEALELYHRAQERNPKLTRLAAQKIRRLEEALGVEALVR